MNKLKKEKHYPPQLPLRFFRWFCHPKLRDSIEGDLIELYQERKAQSGKLKADFKIIIDVLLLFRPGIIKPAEGYQQVNNYGMYKRYFKIGWRNLLRSKGYSFINIGGLAIGMAVAMLIGIWVFDELSFDKHHQNYDRIAQIRMLSTDPHIGETTGGESMQLPLAASLKANYSQYFEHILIAYWISEYTLSYGEKKLPRKGQFIEEGVPDMLSLNMIKGSYSSMKDPHSIILSRSVAEAIFDNEDPINKSLKINNEMDVMVTGIYEDLPLNGRFGEVKFFAPFELLKMSNAWIKESENNWNNSSFTIYVQLKASVTLESASAGIRDFYNKNSPKEWAELIPKFKPELLLYPMAQWHLYSDFKDGKPSGGRITFVWLFGIVGGFVLLLACINFINLTTAHSEKRAKEVGVRKAIGSMKSLLIQQFVTESFLVVFIAFVFSLVLMSLSLPLFSDLASKELSLPFNQPSFWITSFSFLFVTGLMASLYPAFYLSSFQPVRVLKGTMGLGKYSALPRKVLVVVQFTVSLTLIIGTIVVYQQIEFARNRPIGYSREGLISVSKSDPNFIGKVDVLRDELIKTGVVAEVAYSSSPLTAVWNNQAGYLWTGKDPEEASDFSVTYLTYEFGKLVGWEFINGRDFSRSLASDSMSVVINETAATCLKLKNPIGETIKSDDNSGRAWHIIGVIKDMVMSSPYEPEKRALFFVRKDADYASHIHIKINPTVSAQVAIPQIQKVFKEIVPSSPCDYKFVDQQYALKFRQEERLGKLASLFAILAIFISCLGLFGLSAFVAEQRTKEIGVRKVLGASVFNLWKMLSRDFVYLVIISVFIAIPISSYFLNNWLLNYSYRVEIHWWIFAASGVGGLLITLFTVSYQSIKAANSNPVSSLRSE